jgi:hypothetical protein
MMKRKLCNASRTLCGLCSLVLAMFVSLPALAAVSQVVNTVTVTADNQNPTLLGSTVAIVTTLVAQFSSIPTVSAAAIVVMALLLAGWGAILVRRRRAGRSSRT